MLKLTHQSFLDLLTFSFHLRFMLSNQHTTSMKNEWYNILSTALPKEIWNVVNNTGRTGERARQTASNCSSVKQSEQDWDPDSRTQSIRLGQHFSFLTLILFQIKVRVPNILTLQPALALTPYPNSRFLLVSSSCLLSSSLTLQKTSSLIHDNIWCVRTGMTGCILAVFMTPQRGYLSRVWGVGGGGYAIKTFITPNPQPKHTPFQNRLHHTSFSTFLTS